MLKQQFKSIRLIQFRLAFIGLRLEWISEREGRAAWTGGYGANGEFDPERERLIVESDRLLNRLKALDGTLPFQFA